MNMIISLYTLLTAADKKFLTALLVLSFFVSCIEAVSITAIMVFISIATNFSTIFSNQYYKRAYDFLGCTTPVHFIGTIGCMLIIFYIMRGIINSVHVYLLSRFSYTRYHRFTNLLFTRFLHFQYLDFASKNSASLSQAIFSYTGTFTQLIFACLMLASEGLTVLAIYSMLFIVNWKMTLVLSLILGVKSLLLIKVFSRSISTAGKAAQRHTLESNKIFNESVGNFKLIKLTGHEKDMQEQFSKSTQGYASSFILYTTLQNMPRFILETVGFLVLIGLMLYVVYQYSDATFVIPIVSLYALAFYRLLPSVNKILSNVNQVIFARHALEGICTFLQLPTESLGSRTIAFNHSLQLQQVTFRYKPDTAVIDDVEMTIYKGDRIAFVGPSGSGKSTLIGLIMGLFSPTSGRLLVDNQPLNNDTMQAWREKIGYIPQNIYLFDGTVADNVVFGRVYDQQRLIQALQQARIYDFLQTQQGPDTRVGEGGIIISGGQKQRIAIARALYGQPEILILDEATSALDHATESEIMDHIYALDTTITLIIVAHRLTTVARCDVVYNVQAGLVSKESQSDPYQHQQSNFSLSGVSTSGQQADLPHTAG